MTTPAAGYLRRSTLKQELSIAGQRDEILKFAALTGLHIIRWYVDDSISGSTGNERPQFQRLVADAATLRDFKVVIAYDMARFGRMDGDETGHYRFLLRQAGVRILFSNESIGNADDEASEIVRPVLQMQKRQYLRQVSRDTLRGQIQAAKSGWASGRAAAFGFDRVLVDAAGTVQKRLKRGERYAKDRSWHVTLAPSDTPGEVECVQWMFNKYHRDEIGIREIARIMNERGIKSPHNGEWSVGTIREMFRNPVYKGWVCFGRRAMGKFHRMRAGDVRPLSPAEPTVVDRPEEEWVVHKNPAIALIPDEIWDAVNAKLASRGNRARAARARRATYPLCGMIRCADCGAILVGTQRDDVRRYYCSSYYKAKSCNGNSVVHFELINVVKEILIENLFAGGDWNKLQAVIADELYNRPECTIKDTQDLKHKLGQAKAQHARAAQNLLMADVENVPALNNAMNEVRRRVTMLEEVLAGAENAADLSAVLKDAMATAKQQFKDLLSGDDDRLKAVLPKLVDKIELSFGNGTWGCRKIRKVTGCEVSIYAPSAATFTTSGRGDRI